MWNQANTLPVAALRLVSTRNMSEGQRNQIAGLKKRITQALEKAA